MNNSQQVVTYIRDRGWVDGEPVCTFLAAGEYNENYLIESAGKRFVFRINHGTQLGLANQIEYEFRVLEAVQTSDVTPKPYFYSLDGGQLGRGVLLMEYIEGRPLDYRTDLEQAADIFAIIHSLPVSGELIRQENPLHDICTESGGLLARYTPTYYKNVHALLLEYHDRLMTQDHGEGRLFDDEADCIVNTEVNSGNFIIGADKGYLVDWEKAVISSRYQDLAHFLLPTTTLWKSDVQLQEKERELFLTRYVDKLAGNLSLSVVKKRTKLLEGIILLRALSWCLMAYHEYMGDKKALTDKRTFSTITAYLDEAECFLK